MITIQELMELFVDDSLQKVKVFDVGKDDTPIIFEGYSGEIPEKYAMMYVSSLDNIFGECDYLGINVDTYFIDFDKD